MLIYDTEIFTRLSILSVYFSYVCFIKAEIFERMSSGGLEVQFSIYVWDLANSVAPDETPHYAASQRLIWGFPVCLHEFH